MLFSRNWIGDYVALPESAQEVADRLTAAGLAVDSVESVDDDALLDIDITTNRPDCMNHFGLARELAVLTGGVVQEPDASYTIAEEHASAAAELVIEDAELCPRYTALIIRGVEVGPSPDWMVKRLEAIGSRSINNVVDITNYVMWETGQPLHAFDLHRLAGTENGAPAQVRVRRAHDGETLKTLDGEVRKLDPSILVIADAEQAIGLGGIMGGYDSEVTESTVDVLLEAAHFDPKCIQKGSKKLGMHTDASHRFERGADPKACLRASRRAAKLIVELAGGEILAGELDDKQLRDDWPHVLELDLEKLNRFGGVELGSDEVTATLKGLGFGLEPLDAEPATRWRVTVPSWRYYDFENPRVADLYEEVLRIHGFDGIVSTLPQIGGDDAPARYEHVRARRVRDHLVACGYAEAIDFAFTDRSSDQALPSLFGDRAPLALRNPLSDRYAVMRRSLLSNLVASARYNQRRGAQVVRLFEVGHVFADDGEGDRLEMETVAWVVGGQLGTPWERQHDIDFYDLKGVLDSLSALLGVELSVRASQVKGLGNGAAAEIRLHSLAASTAAADTAAADSAADSAATESEAEVIGYLGELDSDDGSYPLFVAELALDRLGHADARLAIQAPSKYPAIAADLTLTHAVDVPWSKIAGTIREHAASELREFDLKDRYRGKGVPAGAVNTTVSFVYNSDERSLAQEEVNDAHERLARRLEEAFGYGSEE
ncbi:MAG: phenylalanine--tRNA ligase subunit beta [Acidobacteriota bacterium]